MKEMLIYYSAIVGLIFILMIPTYVEKDDYEVLPPKALHRGNITRPWCLEYG